MDFKTFLAAVGDFMGRCGLRFLEGARTEGLHYSPSRFFDQFGWRFSHLALGNHSIQEVSRVNPPDRNHVKSLGKSIKKAISSAT